MGTQDSKRRVNEEGACIIPPHCCLDQGARCDLLATRASAQSFAIVRVQRYFRNVMVKWREEDGDLLTRVRSDAALRGRLTIAIDSFTQETLHVL